MSKEEAIKEAYENYYGSPEWDKSVAKHNSEWVKLSLDLWAKQQAIAFAKEYNKGVDDRFDVRYEWFLKSQNKTEQP